MKANLIRALALAMLAASVPAFALDKDCSNDKAQQEMTAKSKGDKNNKKKETKKDKSEKKQDSDLLLNIYG
jgi:hypothetical protein